MKTWLLSTSLSRASTSPINRRLSSSADDSQPSVLHYSHTCTQMVIHKIYHFQTKGLKILCGRGPTPFNMLNHKMTSRLRAHPLCWKVSNEEVWEKTALQKSEKRMI